MKTNTNTPITLMTVKDLHMQLKRGAEVQTLLKRYGIASKEELFKAIRKIAPGKVGEFGRMLKANNKKEERRMSKNNCSSNESEKEKIRGNDAGERQEIISTESTEQKEVIKELSLLEQLEHDEKELSAHCVGLESEHKELAQKRREALKALLEVRKVLVELQRLLAVNMEKVQRIMDEYNESAVRMTQISEEIAVYKELLEEIREQIQETKKVIILVYSEGIIESEAQLPYPSEEEVATLVHSLIQMPEAEDLTIKELKTVAKLLLIVKKMEVKFELEFDSDRVQQFYETVVA